MDFRRRKEKLDNEEIHNLYNSPNVLIKLWLTVTYGAYRQALFNVVPKNVDSL